MNISLDVNTILTSIVLAGIVWMVRSQSLQITATALALQRAEATEHVILELRARVTNVEVNAAQLALRVARIQGQQDKDHETHFPSA